MARRETKENRVRGALKQESTCRAPSAGDISSAANATKNFVIERFSTPEKVSNTLNTIGYAFEVAAFYFSIAASGASVPSAGMSIATAGTAALIFGGLGLTFQGAALIVDIFSEEN